MRSLILAFWIVLSPLANAIDYNGYADMRLIFVSDPGSFNANQDLTIETEQEKAERLAKEAMMAGIMRSMIPLFTKIKAGQSNSADLKTTLLTSSENIRTSLTKSLAKFKSDYDVNHRVLLLPYNLNRKDVYYSGDKISMNVGKLANLIGGRPHGKIFAKHINENLQKMRTSVHRSSKNPADLLGLTAHLHIGKGKNAARWVKIKTLLAIKKTTSDFENRVPGKVHLKKVVIPALADNDINAVMEIDIDLSPKAKFYDLTMHFGEFDQFINFAEAKKINEKALKASDRVDLFDFTIKKKGRQKAAPRLEGNADKPGLRRVALNFSFADLKMDLTTQSLTELDTLLSAGLRIKGKNYTFGAFNLSGVDSEFQNEINNTIQTEIKKTKGSLQKKIMNMAFGAKE